MTTITIDDLQRDAAGCIDRVAAGETVVVVDHDRPVHEIKPVTAQPNEARPIGLAKGQFVVPDDFDDPLPQDIQEMFES